MSYEIGGNKLLYKFGKWLSDRGGGIMSLYKPTVITNPSCKLINPFTLIINFTADVNIKYQIVLQGNYKEKYKESEEGVVNISENDMYNIISESQKMWFKKE